MKKKKRFSKRAYVYLALVTMAAVSLFAKPLKHGLSSLTKRLKKASRKKEHTSLRKCLMSANQQSQERTIRIR